MFNTGKPVTGIGFYDRSAMLKQIDRMLKNRQDFMIKAPRRYGKTSLIKQAMMSVKSPYLYLDLRRTPRIEIVAEKLMDFTYGLEGIKGFFKQLKDNAITLLREGRQTLSVDVEIFEYSIEFFSKQRHPCEMLSEALDIANKIAGQRREQLVVILDEFQDIDRFECGESSILETLRGVMQHHEYITYVFLGSVEHLMSRIFENRRSPFYQFARKFDLAGFDIRELQEDLNEALRTKQIAIEDDQCFRNLLERLEGHPSNTMMVMQNIYYAALEADVKLVNAEMMEIAYANALEEAGDLMDQYINEIKNKKHHYDVLYRLVKGEPQVLEGARLNQVFTGLMEMGHIYREERGTYRVYDGFLVDYIKSL